MVQTSKKFGSNYNITPTDRPSGKYKKGMYHIVQLDEREAKAEM